jgi:hypothetical protein
VLAGGIGNIELPLLKREQGGCALAKILHIVFDVVFLLDRRQRRAQRAERADLDAVPDAVGSEGRGRH